MATIYISIGSNIEPHKYVKAALSELTYHLGEIRCSSVYESEAVGFDGSNFLNMVVAAETDKPIEQVVSLFKEIEQLHGRQRGAKKFSPRTIDLDLLLYDHTVTDVPVVLPRAEITYNAFVLWPLAELAPDTVHPVTQKNYQQMWAEFDKSSQHLWPIEFDWPNQ
ncbi:2-amino-4-hydroxy-6-hydroxymethyldihydropteridine diphosphokinase [Shewanella waksmanii]|uniref:2-amino-4-hydroxy-6- hydroxymethyldihydropteridine diphosphokinase n=1 Tax=Shewanella waksmanii TaxID=213783 RepID=UPI0004913F8C|nr:2-amino-4-hydroxy-6-hydroxymethyldihydropteridine diphosphokinase [Shewanella waksmanii]